MATAKRKTVKKKTARKKAGPLTRCAKMLGKVGGTKSAAKRKVARRGRRNKTKSSSRKQSLAQQISLF